MSLQTYFKEFNKVIKMDYDVKSELKEKRDILSLYREDIMKINARYRSKVLAIFDQSGEL